MTLKASFWFMSIQCSVPAASIEQPRAKDGTSHSPSGAADWWRNEISDRSNTSSYDSSLGTFVVFLVVYCILQMGSHKSGCVRCSSESANINTSSNPAKFWNFHEFGGPKRVVLNKMLRLLVTTVFPYMTPCSHIIDKRIFGWNFSACCSQAWRCRFLKSPVNYSPDCTLSNPRRHHHARPRQFEISFRLF